MCIRDRACVAHGAADHKTPRRIDVILRVLIEPLRRQHGLDDVLQDVRMQLIVAYGLGVLT